MRSVPTWYRYMVKDTEYNRVDFPKMSKQLQFLASFFLTADDVQDILHSVQVRTWLLTRCTQCLHKELATWCGRCTRVITGSTQFSNTVWGRSQYVYMTCTWSTRLITGSTRSIHVHLEHLVINRPHLVEHLVGRVHHLATNGKW